MPCKKIFLSATLKPGSTSHGSKICRPSAKMRFFLMGEPDWSCKSCHFQYGVLWFSGPPILGNPPLNIPLNDGGLWSMPQILRGSDFFFSSDGGWTSHPFRTPTHGESDGESMAKPRPHPPAKSLGFISLQLRTLDRLDHGFLTGGSAKSGSSFSGSPWIPPIFGTTPFDLVKYCCSYISHQMTCYYHHGNYVVTLIPWFVVGWIHHSWRTPFHSSLIPKYVNIPRLLFDYYNIIISHNSSSSAQEC